MKLSEAILLGSIGTEQAFRQLYDKGKTCAFGAAFMAVGKDVEHMSGPDELIVAKEMGWGWAWEQRAECPCVQCNYTDTFIMYIITHLNDFCKWPRPKIAGWVATLEAVHAAPKVEPIMEPRCVSR